MVIFIDYNFIPEVTFNELILTSSDLKFFHMVFIITYLNIRQTLVRGVILSKAKFWKNSNVGS